MTDGRPERWAVTEFERLVATALERLALGAHAIREPRIDGTIRPDIVLERPGTPPSAVEVRAVHPATNDRLEKLVAQVKHIQGLLDRHSRLGSGEPILVVSGVFAGGKSRIPHLVGVQVIDGPKLRELAPDLPWPEFVAENPQTRSGPERYKADELRFRLSTVSAGRGEWAAFQELVRDILEHLFSPPLASPLWERKTENGVNRRDIILPNYAETGFWAFLRAHYEAHFVVVDAKNLVGGVTKAAVLQIANYLEAHGAGLVGIIVCRNAPDRAAEATRREQWAIHRKLIIVLNDDDLNQMITSREIDQDPSELIRQKIEDFRLGF